MRERGFATAGRAPRWRRPLTGGIALTIGLATASLAGLPATVVHASTLTVTNCNDSGSGSLRGEVLAASSGDTITFALSPSCSLITLTSGVIAISENLTITGPGASVLAVSGNDASTVFGIGSGATVGISGLTIENGNAVVGGGIANAGMLTVTNSTLSGNTASIFGSGGGIYNNGTLTVTNSTLSGNSTYEGAGGGIYNNGGTLTVTNSTLSGNSAGEGGGVFNLSGGMLTVTSSTLSGNSALFGGGIYNVGTATVTDTIVANSPSGLDCYLYVALTDGGHNLADDSSCGVTTGAPHFDVLGNPLLGPLASNGGPTQTLALLTGSPAIGTGGTCPAVDGGVDQRGLPRKNPCDIGAYETQPPCTSTNPSGATLTVAAGQRVCLTGVTVLGTVTVQPGGSLSVINSTVNGAVTASGANGISVCGSTLRGAVSVQNSTGPVEIGADTGCAPNTIGGAVTLTGNAAGVELVGNHIGGRVTITGTTGPPDEIAGNTVAGTLACSGNTPAPVDNSEPNHVTGARSGQTCASAAF